MMAPTKWSGRLRPRLAGGLAILVLGMVSACGSEPRRATTLLAVGEDSELRIVSVPGSLGQQDQWTAGNRQGVEEFYKECMTNYPTSDSCEKIQKHPEEKYAPYFRDSQRCGVCNQNMPALDHDRDNGIDAADVVFYAGHAAMSKQTANLPPTSVWVPHKHLRFGDGNPDGDRGMRYFLGCACNILAHGPACNESVTPAKCWSPKPTDRDFTRPRFYERGKNHRNVGRWLNGMAPELRMICGGSSLLCDVSSKVAARFWSYYGSHAVADAFILAAVDGKRRIPVCLTHGGENPKETPLELDVRFTAEANRKNMGQYLHLLYPTIVIFEDQPSPTEEELEKAASKGARMPLLTAERAKPDRWLDRDPASPEEAGSGVDQYPRDSYYEDPDSGAVSFSAEGLEFSPLNDLRGTLERLGFQQQPDGVTEKNINYESRVQLRYQSWLRGSDQLVDKPKGIFDLLGRRISLGLEAWSLPPVGFIGWEDELVLSAEPEENEIRVTLLWRDIRPVKRETDPEEEEPYPIRGFHEAYREALKRLGKDGKYYRMWRWQWGYLAEDPRCRRSLMPLIYRFSFEATTAEDWRWYPPRIIDVSGFRERPIPDRICLDD